MLKIDAIIAIANNMGDLIVDARPVSLTGSTLQFNELVHPQSGQLQGVWGYIYAGAGAGQERVVGSFNPATNTVVFPQVFASVPSTNSDVMLTKEWRKADYDAALNRYIGIARTRFMVERTATLALVATQYEYPVPSGIEWIRTLRLIPSTNSDYDAVDDVREIFELPPRLWRLEVNQGGSYLITINRLKQSLEDLDNQLVFVMGQAKPDIAATDNATIPEDLEEFLITGASMLLSSQREGTEWGRKFQMFRESYRPLEDYISRHGYGKKVR